MEKIYTLVDCESDFTIKLTSGEFVEYREYTEEQVHSFAQQVLPWEVEENYEEEHLFSDGDNGGHTTSENYVYPIFPYQMLVKGSEVIGCIIDDSKLLFEDCDREIKNLSRSSEGRHDITERTIYRLRKAKGYGSVWTWDESSNTITIFGDSISITQYFRDNAKKVIIEDGVTIIEDSTFAACKKLESVIVPESIEHVGYQAFKDCPMLRFQKMSDIRYLGNETNPFLVAVDAEEKKCHYTLSDSTKVISDGVFEFHYSLESIVIPEGVTTIGEKAFAFCCALKSVTLPDSMKSIGKEAFYECGLLESIVIPEGVTTIGEKAFAKCCSLKSANLPKSVKDIGDAAFWDCKLLRNTDFPDRLMFNMRDFQIEDGVLVNYKGSDSDLLIPNGVTRIGAYSLSRAYWGLKNVRIPEGVTEIGKGAFYGCKDLECISLPDSLKNIEETALQSTSLRTVNIPHGITTIDNAVFFGCDKLKEINIPDGVENIGGFAFTCCYSLESAVIPGSVRNIGKDAFGSCRSLKYVTINNGVKVIGEKAFHGCRSLESITIPESVKHIGRSAFYECDSLKTVMILGESCDIERDAFLGCAKRLNIVVPKIGIVDDDKESSYRGFLAYPELYEDSAKAQIREYMKKYEAEALRGFKIRDFSREAFADFLEKLNPDDAWLDFLKKLFADSKTIES